MSRRSRAIDAIRQAIELATDRQIPRGSFAADDDLVDDLSLCPLELEQLGLFVGEIFQGISIDSESLFSGPLYRTPESLADWCIRKADEAAWAESQRQRKRA